MLNSNIAFNSFVFVLFLAGILCGFFLKLRTKIALTAVFILWFAYFLIFEREGYNFNGLAEAVVIVILSFAIITMWAMALIAYMRDR